MSLSINNSTSSSLAVNQLGRGQKGLDASLERIATGRRINRAADDAAGMAIADRLLSQARGLGQGMQNANDVIAMSQIADSAMAEGSKLVQSIREKALQAANASQSPESRQALQADIEKSLAALDTIAKSTSYNGQQLLGGEFSNKSFQVGGKPGETVSLSIASMETGRLGGESPGFLSDINVGTEEGAQAALKIADEALAQIDAERGRVGSTTNQLSAMVSTMSSTQTNLFSAASAINDVDLAEESMVFSQMKSLNEAKSFALAQTKNLNKQNILSLLQG